MDQVLDLCQTYVPAKAAMQVQRVEAKDVTVTRHGKCMKCAGRHSKEECPNDNVEQSVSERLKEKNVVCWHKRDGVECLEKESLKCPKCVDLPDSHQIGRMKAIL